MCEKFVRFKPTDREPITGVATCDMGVIVNKVIY